ncbi:MAG TPA: hypothetical protein VGU90_12830 [Terriglobales bacterium]|nr:hypothetical protein [Terriglobales bacterium]
MALLQMCFRLEAEDGSAAEYRIQDEDIEVRQLQSPDEDEREWRCLSANEIAEHVSRNTVVAKWLERRLGWRRLLRACLAEGNPHFAQSEASVTTRRAA